MNWGWGVFAGALLGGWWFWWLAWEPWQVVASYRDCGFGTTDPFLGPTTQAGLSWKLVATEGFLQRPLEMAWLLLGIPTASSMIAMAGWRLWKKAVDRRYVPLD